MQPESAPAWIDGTTAGDDLVRLVERVRAGEQAAEAELVERFSRGLLLMLRRLTQNPALADDLHQETLVLVIEKIRRGEVRDPGRLAGFIRSVARNLFIADRRKEARYLALDEEGKPPAAAAASLPDHGPPPLERALAEEETRQVQSLLGELRNERDRQLLIRFYLTDDRKEQICHDLDIEPERFNQLLHRARERLRDLWERSEKRRRFFSGVRGMVGSFGRAPTPRR
jgi:RNA polymerase sigma-70 factor (ECF subfamily)